MKKPTLDEAGALLSRADQILPAQAVAAAVRRLAAEISTELQGEYPLVLAVMRGAVVFAGQLLPLLEFPLDFDYIDATRYGAATTGGELRWRAEIPEGVSGRCVLVLDDILDEGHTLEAIRKHLLRAGATKVMLAVFAEKDTGRSKPVVADFVGTIVPDRFVFGFGMDARGMWRNLPAVYALKQGD